MCNYCGNSLKGRQTRFCSSNHRLNYYKFFNSNKPIPLRIGSSIVYTRKYDRIDEVISKYRSKKYNGISTHFRDKNISMSRDSFVAKLKENI